MQVEVAVLGGGPAGAVAALLLARAGLPTVVFEAHPGPRAKVGETLPPELRPLLARLDLLTALEAGGHRACHGHRSYWGGPEVVEKDFVRGPFGSGWHLDRKRFEGMLARAAEAAGADFAWDHHAVQAHRTRGRWSLEIEGPAALVRCQASFIIDATGRHARFACGIGARHHIHDNLVGVATTLAGAQAAVDGYTQVEAVQWGYWYTAPLDGARLVVVYLSDGDLIDSAAVRSRDGYRALLAGAPHTRQRIAAVGLLRAELPWSAPQLLPARSACLQPMCGSGWLAVGDAVAAFDPLSSHGIGSAITSGYYGACAAADHLSGKADALDAYRQLMTSVYADYRVLLYEHYAQEQRWPASPFWRRRHHDSVGGGSREP